MEIKRQLAFRIGEPYKLHERNTETPLILNGQRVGWFPSDVSTDSSTYFIGEDELAFTAVLVDFEPFEKGEEWTELEVEIICFSHRLVEGIDAPVYLRTSITAKGSIEQRWEELPKEHLPNLVESISSTGKRAWQNELYVYLRESKLKEIGL